MPIALKHMEARNAHRSDTSTNSDQYACKSKCSMAVNLNCSVNAKTIYTRERVLNFIHSDRYAQGKSNCSKLKLEALTTVRMESPNIIDT